MAPNDKAAADFKKLTDEAAAGRLMLRADAAEQCAIECDKYARRLRELRAATAQLVRKRAYGNFGSAQLLAGKFEKLATGSDPSEASVALRIDQRIEMVAEMARTFRQAGAAYRDADGTTSRAAADVDPRQKV